MHVYIHAGLQSISKTEISILEIGFGTGLNAFLTLIESKQRGSRIMYSSIEKYPLTHSDYMKLNYPEIVDPGFASQFIALHKARWNEPENISSEFTIHKLKADLLEFSFQGTELYDLIYFDAFAPSKQPELWTDEVLAKVAATLKPNGIFVTYSAKGTVRRALSESGLKMFRLQGPAGKKEMLKGIKQE
jgi:tRNA U34 5-methylaminomethyl-2-thiouridine-forming methyltransferase MnmC